MAINPISTPAQTGLTSTTRTDANKSKTEEAVKDTKQAGIDTKAAVYDKSQQPAKNSKSTYTRESVRLNEISRQAEEKYAQLRGIVEKLFTMQSLKKGERKGLSYDQIMEKYHGELKNFYQNLEVDMATSLEAQQEISEDGFWGVKETSGRMIEFAISLSGDDPAKLASLKDAIEKGYQAAEDAWGGALPDICKQTKEATLKGLDEWANKVNNEAS